MVSGARSAAPGFCMATALRGSRFRPRRPLSAPAGHLHRARREIRLAGCAAALFCRSRPSALTPAAYRQQPPTAFRRTTATQPWWREPLLVPLCGRRAQMFLPNLWGHRKRRDIDLSYSTTFTHSLPCHNAWVLTPEGARSLAQFGQGNRS